MKLTVIIASTRPGRLGDQIGEWIAEYSKAKSEFDVEVADLLDIQLPMFDEPGHPMQGVYQNNHTKAWSKLIEGSDAFIIVTPEYNYTIPPALLNAFDYLHHEWKHKPVGFVGYGGTGAVRAIQTEKLLVTNLSMMPLATIVSLPGIYRPVTDTFSPTEIHTKAADVMLAELYDWSEALHGLRAKRKARHAA